MAELRDVDTFEMIQFGIWNMLKQLYKELFSDGTSIK